MKILFSFSLCLLLSFSLPTSLQAQETDENSQRMSLSINGENWEPQITQAEYLLEKGQKIEMVSFSMYRLEGRDIDHLSFKLVRFEGPGKYKAGEKYSLIGLYQQTPAGGKEGPHYNIVEGSGKLEITDYDAKNLTISGTFSFDLMDGSEDRVKVTEGKFKKIQLKDVTPEDKD